MRDLQCFLLGLRAASKPTSPAAPLCPLLQSQKGAVPERLAAA